MKFLIWAFRIILGGVFIFSGIVKANDPLGLTYKMQEIFDVWQIPFLGNYAFAFSVLMIAFEIIAGMAMLVGNYFRLYVSLMLFINVFYTFLTGYILYTDKVRECGCFGDCFKISNSATFYKDIALTAVNLFLFIFRFRVFPIFKKSSVNFIIVFVTAVFSFVFQWWTLHHLPVHDCLPYKPGNNLLEKMKPAPNATEAVYETLLTYEKNGIKKDFAMDKIPWQDKSWKFVSQNSKLIKEATGQAEIHDFKLEDKKGNEKTQEVLSAKGYTFLWFVRDPTNADVKFINKIKNIAKKSNGNKDFHFYALASVSKDIFQTYLEVWDMKDLPFFLIDGTVNKTAIRTNPGLMLLKDGVVVKKWSYLDYPKDVEMDNGNLICK